jgi:hypothetical protein
VRIIEGLVWVACPIHQIIKCMESSNSRTQTASLNNSTSNLRCSSNSNSNNSASFLLPAKITTLQDQTSLLPETITKLQELIITKQTTSTHHQAITPSLVILDSLLTTDNLREIWASETRIKDTKITKDTKQDMAVSP